MSRLALNENDGGDRFPKLDVMSQSQHWDDVTNAVVQARLGVQAEVRFFNADEEGTATALFDQILDQSIEPRIPVVHMVDARLADRQTDGWHYDDMPSDQDAWRASLKGLDEDARDAGETNFALASWDTAGRILQAIQDLGMNPWHGMTAGRVWSLWTRYACSAFYSHPWAWDEIGFSGPAYPRGYKNLGIGKLEPFEVPDQRPEANPSRRDEGAPEAGDPDQRTAGTPAKDTAHQDSSGGRRSNRVNAAGEVDAGKSRQHPENKSVGDKPANSSDHPDQGSEK